MSETIAHLPSGVSCMFIGRLPTACRTAGMVAGMERPVTRRRALSAEEDPDWCEQPATNTAAAAATRRGLVIDGDTARRALTLHEGGGVRAWGAGADPI